MPGYDNEQTPKGDKNKKKSINHDNFQINLDKAQKELKESNYQSRTDYPFADQISFTNNQKGKTAKISRKGMELYLRQIEDLDFQIEKTKNHLKPLFDNLMNSQGLLKSKGLLKINAMTMILLIKQLETEILEQTAEIDAILESSNLAHFPLTGKPNETFNIERIQDFETKLEKIQFYDKHNGLILTKTQINNYLNDLTNKQKEYTSNKNFFKQGISVLPKNKKIEIGHDQYNQTLTVLENTIQMLQDKIQNHSPINLYVFNNDDLKSIKESMTRMKITKLKQLLIGEIKEHEIETNDDNLNKLLQKSLGQYATVLICGVIPFTLEALVSTQIGTIGGIVALPVATLTIFKWYNSVKHYFKEKNNFKTILNKLNKEEEMETN